MRFSSAETRQSLLQILLVAHRTSQADMPLSRQLDSIRVRDSLRFAMDGLELVVTNRASMGGEADQQGFECNFLGESSVRELLSKQYSRQLPLFCILFTLSLDSAKT